MLIGNISAVRGNARGNVHTESLVVLSSFMFIHGNLKRVNFNYSCNLVVDYHSDIKICIVPLDLDLM